MKLKERLEGFMVGSIVVLAILFFFAPLDPIRLNAALTLVLAVATAGYAVVTNLILTEAQKDRKIRQLEKKLENLYSPLKYNKSWIDQPSHFSANDPKYSEYRDFLLRLRENAHLASPELRGKIEVFLSGIDNPLELEKSRQGGGAKWKEFIDARDKIKSIADKDIEEIRRELEKLMS